MKLKQPLSLAAFWLACAYATSAAAGDAAPVLARAADPAAAVPPTRYQPALPYFPAPAAATSPDQHWADANRTVAAYDSMSLTMDSAPATPTPAPAPTPAPEPARAPAQKASQPAAGDHSQHMHHQHGSGK